MLTTEERISRARIQLQKQNSFWAYLSLFLKFKECKKGKMTQDTMGIDPRGNVFYVKEFIDKLSDDELIGLITHEINHLVFLTQLRQGNRDPIGWNIASDLTINTLLKNNNFKLPAGGVIPDHNNELNIGSKIIKDCDKKIAEEVYDELPKIKMKANIYTIGDGKNKGKELGKAIDVHLSGEEKGGKGKKGSKGLSPNEKEALKKEWNRRVQEALTASKMKGDLPAGLERLVEDLHKEQIDWKSLLQNFITNQIPYDYSYHYPSKKSISCGVYMPSILKEKIEIALMIDLSGSIGQKQYADFISEIIGICKAYQERITMRIFSHDVDCYDGGIIENGNIDKVKKMNLKGGGGTSFETPLKYLKDNNIAPKCLIWLTDGFGDSFKKPNFPILWVLTKDGSDDLLKDSGQVIKLRD